MIDQILPESITLTFSARHFKTSFVKTSYHQIVSIEEHTKKNFKNKCTLGSRDFKRAHRNSEIL